MGACGKGHVASVWLPVCGAVENAGVCCAACELSRAPAFSRTEKNVGAARKTFCICQDTRAISVCAACAAVLLVLLVWRPPKLPWMLQSVLVVRVLSSAALVSPRATCVAEAMASHHSRFSRGGVRASCRPRLLTPRVPVQIHQKSCKALWVKRENLKPRVRGVCMVWAATHAPFTFH